MRHIILIMALVALLVVGVAPVAFAHVHGITPLLELGCKVDNTITGANRADDTPAGSDNGGPIGGLIPNTVGNASLVPGTLGFGRAADSVCP